MASASYVVVGRAPGCGLLVSGSTVSGRHARLRWEAGALWLEDLGSANGTFVDGERIRRAVAVQIGQDVRFGAEPLPWHDERLRAFLRHGASDTILAMPRFGRYRCPKCQALGVLPPGFKQGEMACHRCGTALLFGDAARGPRSAAIGLGLGGTLLAAAVFVVAVMPGAPAAIVHRSEVRAGAGRSSGGMPASDEEPASIPIGPSRTQGTPSAEEEAVRGSGTAARVMRAMDAGDAATRNFAVQVASRHEGPFHVDQVAALWMRIRAEFDYVNDPRGGEYFARASETISNGFAGDCDDFATTLAGSVGAIGGRARVVMMDGPAGGHAYAEACVDAPPEEVARRLRLHVRRHWDRRLGRLPNLARIHHRTDASCSVWLNLDWNANYPAGPYGQERWAVAIEADGGTETLAPSSGPVGTTAAQPTAR